MPYFSLETNRKIDAKVQFTKAATDFISGLLEKPSKFIMISLKDQHEMRFAGSTDATAFIQLRSIGLPDDNERLISEICRFTEKEINIPAERIYVELIYLKREEFGWNGKSFAR
ncbi:MAG TPA: phenylpyruvate tautomerase MIF-related protein [Bacteroidales bacterium]|nr:phenylpyruvate tautomerase MIF-related protein [Bacteroidales bacterium]